MKLYARVLLLPLASHALQLPLNLNLPNFKYKLDSYHAQLPTIASLRSHLEMPQFLKKFSDPIAASPVLSLHRSLVQIPSITGNERNVADWLVSYLTAQNFSVETQTVVGDRINVLAYPGTNRSTHTLLTSHIDTVPPYIPYKSASSIIHGRGTNDAKGSVAAQIVAVQELLAAGTIHPGNVSLLFVVGEEYDGIGMRAANDLGVAWKTVIFGEPTENKLAIGHKGILLFDILSSGKASHSGYPHLGINANSQLIEALAILDKLQLPGSDLLGESTLNIGCITGGVASNVIPASANASIAVRVAGDLDEIIATIKDSVSKVPGITITPPSVAYGAVELDHDVEGFETIVCSYGTDVPNLKGDHKKYLYGPGSILTAHGDNEYVLKSDLFDAVNGYKALIKESLCPTKRVPDIIEGQGLFDKPAPVTAVTVGKVVETLGIRPPKHPKQGGKFIKPAAGAGSG